MRGNSLKSAWVWSDSSEGSKSKFKSERWLYWYDGEVLRKKTTGVWFIEQRLH